MKYFDNDAKEETNKYGQLVIKRPDSNLISGDSTNENLRQRFSFGIRTKQEKYLDSRINDFLTSIHFKNFEWQTDFHKNIVLNILCLIGIGFCNENIQW